MAGHRGSTATVSTRWRLWLALWLVLCVAGTSEAESRKVYDINLQEQSLADALNGLSEQTGASVVFPYDLVRNKRAGPVVGRYTLSEALDALLRDTGLSGGLSYKGVLTISATRHGPPNTGATILNNNQNTPNANPQRVKRPAGIAAFFAAVAAAFSASAEEPNTDSRGLEQVVVTAEKKTERLQDVPIPVTAIGGATLDDSNQLSLQDYYSLVPGLNIATNLWHSTFLSIRGISTGSNSYIVNPTVGITVDDVPYGGSWGYGFATQLPDVDPADLARIEVLRGPQGTLYGASSMGGLLKYVTIDPSTKDVSGRLEAGASDVHNGAEVGYSARGSVNVPLTETLAIRASAFTRLDPGYIDNPVRHIDGINEERTSGARVAALWRPTDTVSLKLSALYQNQKTDGESVVTIPTPDNYYFNTLSADQQSYTTSQQSGLTGLQQNFAPGTGKSERQVQAYSANLNAKLGNVDLTVLSGYNVNSHDDNYDGSVFFYGYTQPIYGTPYSLGYNVGTTRKYSEEIRLSGSIWEKVDWLLGGFYTHERSDFTNNNVVAVDQTGAPIAAYYIGQNTAIYREYAGFADITLHVFDRFDVQIGARESQIKESYTGFYAGPLVGDVVTATPYPDVSANAFTYLFTPQFKITPDAMIYARLASGYRAGGPNRQPVLQSQGTVPSSYNPDKTYNYEVGAKADFLDHTLSLDASLYYIDWKGIQLQETTALGGTYIGNAAKAKSEGLELTVAVRPVSGLTVAGWIAVGKAELTADLPLGSGAYGISGDRLPNTSRVSGNVSVDENFALTADVTAFVGGVVSYMGDRKWDFTLSSYRQDLPAYTKVDLRAGLKYGQWTMNVYGNNIGDKRGLLAGAENQYFPYDLTYIQPRTVGLNLVRTF
jgi:iron complex outermembrane receptor protein